MLRLEFKAKGKELTLLMVYDTSTDEVLSELDTKTNKCNLKCLKPHVGEKVRVLYRYDDGTTTSMLQTIKSVKQMHKEYYLFLD